MYFYKFEKNVIKHIYKYKMLIPLAKQDSELQYEFLFRTVCNTHCMRSQSVSCQNLFYKNVKNPLKSLFRLNINPFLWFFRMKT